VLLVFCNGTAAGVLHAGFAVDLVPEAETRDDQQRSALAPATGFLAINILSQVP
jgi:hypothetical protein